MSVHSPQPRRRALPLQIRGKQPSLELRRQMQADLGGLGGLTKITGAEAALHCHPEVTLACQAVVTLAVSGRELHAAARDHTWLAAWRKAVARLRAQIVEQRRLGHLPRRIPRKPAAARAAKPTF